jgi:hypothetical protein
MNDKDVTVVTVADLATENKTLSESDNVKKEEVYQDPVPLFPAPISRAGAWPAHDLRR